MSLKHVVPIENYKLFTIGSIMHDLVVQVVVKSMWVYVGAMMILHDWIFVPIVVNSFVSFVQLKWIELFMWRDSTCPNRPKSFTLFQSWKTREHVLGLELCYFKIKNIYWYHLSLGVCQHVGGCAWKSTMCLVEHHYYD